MISISSSFILTQLSTISHTHAQFNLETFKKRDLIIDLENGLQTKAQLTLPVVGNGPYPGVLLILGSGAEDMNETAGYVYLNKTTGEKLYPPTPFFDISKYLSERGFVVLKYDKRGIGENHTILDTNIWGNMTQTDLKNDAEKALDVLIHQPEVDRSRISVLGHSEGTVIVPKIAIENPDKIKNIILMGAVAQNISSILRFQVVDLPLKYAKEVLDKDGDGLISINGSSNDPLFLRLIGGNYSNILTSRDLHSLYPTYSNNSQKVQLLNSQFNKYENDEVSILEEIQPSLEHLMQRALASSEGKCTDLEGCQMWMKSFLRSPDNLDVINLVPSNTSILILNGENDTQTPVEQSLLLQQKLTEINHPDHTLITYPNLGHEFAPSSEWFTENGPIASYVLQDMYRWLSSPLRDR